MEWPGEKRKSIDLDVTPKVYAAVRNSRMTVPLGNPPDLAEVAGLPWCSVATIRSNGEMLHRVVGPAISQKDQWELPILFIAVEPGTGLMEHQREAEKLRRAWELEGPSAQQRR